ncbi:Metal transporter system, ATP-binding protein [[Mycoplasma] cavipharyngis]|uniref:ATP-binding cassette domain-containing protein n=1 Tax=[Mycoplasma] cavipharyngis TaxID=92757 RepID=UPI003704D104
MNNQVPLIELKNISKTYKLKIHNLLNQDLSWAAKFKKLFFETKQVLIKDLNLKIYSGERIALIGNNGAGKSTLSNIICGYQKATSGQIIHNYTYKKHPKERISIQFQSGSFPANFYVYDVLNLTKIFSKEDDAIISNLYNLLEIDKIINKKVRSLSGGEQQRLILYTSLISDPLLLILDEYSNNLDLKSKEEVGNYLSAFLKESKITVLIISHDASQIYRFANKIYLMKNGEIIDQIDDIKSSFPSIESLRQYIVKNI